MIDCSSAPAYDSGAAKSGWDVDAGPATGTGTWVGVRSGDPYVIGRYDTGAKTVTVGVWQPWYASEPTAGVVYGPWFVDDSVTVGPGGVQKCDTSIKPTVRPPAAPHSARPQAQVGAR